MSKKIGFNNFKAFGPKMQFFSKKPITLIYGPNSIGKSSLLHSQIYLDYYKQFEYASNLYSNNFAGDKLDLGGIKNFIHQHNINSSITYEYRYSKKEDILKILNFNDQMLTELFFDQKINFNYTLSEIETKLNMDFEDTGIKFKYLLQLRASEHQFEMDVCFGDLLLTKNEIKTQLLKKRDTFYIEIYNSLDSSIYKNVDELKNIFTNIYKNLDEKVDVFEKLLLATYESDPLYIFNTLNFFKYVSTISKINYSIKLFLINDEIKTHVDFSINDDNVFQYNSTDKSLQVNQDHEIINLANNLNRDNKKYSNYRGEVSLYDFFHFSLMSIMNTIFKIEQIQYYGPLRHYPDRWELSIIAKEKQTLQDEKYIPTKLTIFILKVVRYLEKIADYFKSKKFPIKIFALLINYLRATIMFYLPMFSKSFRKQLFESDVMKDAWNHMLPERFQLTREKKLKSSEIWKKLIDSNEVVIRLNKWLGNQDKLKSNYEIKIEKKRIFLDSIFFHQLYKLIDKEGVFFSKISEIEDVANYDLLEKCFFPIIKFFHSLFKYFEKKMNFIPRYIYHICFIDQTNKTKVTPRDMGLGISQMLPILISTNANKNTKMYIEQPELHLHPAVQMELMDEFIKSHNLNNNTYMIESHSEHILLRIMKRMRQTADGTLQDESLKLTPDDVCLLYVDNDGEHTYIQELRLGKKGNLLDHWPNGFFEEGYKERFS